MTSRPLKPENRMSEFEAFDDPTVEDAFASFDPPILGRLLELRQLIYETARRTQAVGPLLESLKWGQPSYVPATQRTGSPIRLGRVGDSPALLFHCQTTLVESFRHQYEDVFRFEGNRALIVKLKGRLPKRALGDCITQALTYHL